jgi:hypothetical protein
MSRHPFDPFSLLFGALLVSVGASFVAGSTIAEAWRSVWPMIAVVVGVTLAAWAAVSAFRERTPVRAEVEPREDLDGSDVADNIGDLSSSE